MSNRPHGKYVNINLSNPRALGVCDYSGYIFNREDLVKQMDWRGNALVWTGFLVGKPFLDIPNDQARPPILPPDPIPVQMPRLPQNKTVTWSQGLGITWENLNTMPWGSWGSTYNAIPIQPENTILQQLQSARWGS